MTDPIRNAFVVNPEGVAEERAFPERWSPLVNALENLHGELRKHQEESK